MADTTPPSALRIGVLALQGDFREHIAVLQRLGAHTVEVRKPADLEGLDGLIIPGGESTTFGILARKGQLIEPLRDFVTHHPTWGTCAGAIFLAKHVDGETPHLSAMDISVTRNAFGRQIDSFVGQLNVKGMDRPYEAVFIRAPILSVLGPHVEVLAALDDGRIVAARQQHLLATSFHPELTPDDRFHRYFLTMVGTYAIRQTR